MSRSASPASRHTREQQTKMDEYRERLETLLLDTEDFELIAKLAKLLPVIRMTEQIRAMAADLKIDIAAKRACRSAKT